MANEKKEVFFNDYCPKCKYKDLDISDNVPDVQSELDWKNKPAFFHDKDKAAKCHECLNQGYNWDSHKPINFEEKEE